MSNTARNPITGDLIRTGNANDNYRNGWEVIFGKKKDQNETGHRQEQLSASDSKESTGP